MSTSKAALLVIDAQESFRRQSYWSDADVPAFLERVQALVDGAKTRGIPVVQIFHVEPEGAFSPASGHVRTLEGLSLIPDAVFEKPRHSARHASDSGYQVDYVTEATLTFPMTGRRGRIWSSEEIQACTELVLAGRFARIASVEEALAGRVVAAA